MAKSKHRDDQIFAAPVDFLKPVTMADALTVEGPLTVAGGVVQTGLEGWAPAILGRVGATAGWVNTGRDDDLLVCPASQTNATFIVPLTTQIGPGWQVNSITAQGRIESAGNAVTVSMAVRRSAPQVAGYQDILKGSVDTLGPVTADTIIQGAQLQSVFTEVINTGESLYAILTATTAALTAVEISGFLVNYNKT